MENRNDTLIENPDGSLEFIDEAEKTDEQELVITSHAVAQVEDASDVMASTKTAPTGYVKPTALQLQAQVLELKKRGLSFREIGVAIGRNEANAYRMYKRAILKLANNNLDEAREVRVLELARLDSLRLALYPQIKQGNVQAIQTALKISERIAKLTGIDSPLLIESKSVVETQMTEEQIRRMAEVYLNGTAS